MITRKFNKSYDDALLQANLFHSEFIADQPLFEAFSLKFSSSFADEFLNLIAVADDIRTNQDDLNTQTAITADLELKMELCRKHYLKLLLHVEFAWSRDEAKLKIFGKDFYLDARKIPYRMVNLLQDTFREANSTAYKDSLLAAGFVEADITLLDTFAEDLQNKLYEQQSFIRHVSSRTEERTVAFNKVWDVMTQISSAAKLIFVDSPAKTEYYLLYPEGNGVGNLTTTEKLTLDNVSLDSSPVVSE